MTHITGSQTDAYLERLGVETIRHDFAGLEALHRAQLHALPFHNLLTLASRPSTELVEAWLDSAIQGLGGAGLHLTVPFAVLLSSLGFRVEVIEGRTPQGRPHGLVLVELGHRRLLLDVGGAHPCPFMWDLDGPDQEQTFEGWRFRFARDAPAGPTVTLFHEGGARPLFSVGRSLSPMDAEARVTTPSRELLAARIDHDVVITVRGLEYTRHSRFGTSVRKLRDGRALRNLLVRRLRLAPDLVDQALPRVQANGDGRVHQSADVHSVPDILVSVATVGRHASLTRLLDSLRREQTQSAYPGRIGLLLVENHRHPTVIGERHSSLPIHTVSLASLRKRLEQSAGTGVLPPPGEEPVPIGVAREAQLHAIRAHLAKPAPGLPHPARRPTVVWMIDDDLTFEQLGQDGTVERRVNLLHRVANYWSSLPHHSVILGTFTGDPPVPGLDTLCGQLRDLKANLTEMICQGPNAAWAPPPVPFEIFDAYYDLSEAPGASDCWWPFAPQEAGRPVADVASELLGQIPRLLEGSQVTRPLVWTGVESAPRPSLRRGGNTVFLDLDALFRWPTPVAQTSDGMTTRRADTLWAVLAAHESPDAVVEAPLPLFHGRDGQQIPGGADRTSAQARGVALARALAHRRPVADELTRREQRVARHRAETRELIAELRNGLTELETWPGVSSQLECAQQQLAELDSLVQSSTPQKGDPNELQEFLDALPAAVEAWRRLW